MPYIRVVYNGDASLRGEIASNLAKIIAVALSKPEEYVMLDVTINHLLALGGSISPCAMVQVESIGGSCNDVCSPITNELSRITGIVPDRIFVNFASFKSDSWALAGSTIG